MYVLFGHFVLKVVKKAYFLNIILSDFKPVNRVLRASVVRLSLVGERKNAVSPDPRRAADGLTFCKLFLLTMNCTVTYC